MIMLRYIGCIHYYKSKTFYEQMILEQRSSVGYLNLRIGSRPSSIVIFGKLKGLSRSLKLCLFKELYFNIFKNDK